MKNKVQCQVHFYFFLIQKDQLVLGLNKRKRRNNIELSIPGASSFTELSPDTNTPKGRRIIHPEFDEIVIASQSSSHQIIKVKKKSQESISAKYLEDYLQSLEYYIPKPNSQLLVQNDSNQDLLKDLMKEYSDKLLEVIPSKIEFVFYELKPIEDILKNSSSKKDLYVSSSENRSSGTILNVPGAQTQPKRNQKSGLRINNDLTLLLGKKKEEGGTEKKRLSTKGISFDLNFD
jgi:hypothetical protein